ncbi:MAG TPA: cbb3-type cytochrome c oxidase subunit I, partial [Actinomycetota bacterium]|nr:cbb3-type cytochrome c oxidase subunit I [Actinomycetota bacterium]
ISMTLFSAASFTIAIPSAIQVFAWIATALAGRPLLRTPMLFALGFVLVFVIGGVTGVMFASVPFDQQITDSYFVVAHFHYVLFGGAVFPILAGVYFWLPKMSGRMYAERLGQASFWLVFAGFNLTFFPMHVSGLLGMPRRIYTYPTGMGWDVYNLLATVGAFVLAVGLAAVVANVAWTVRRGAPAGADPWRADTLEWSLPSPPPPYAFPVIPTVTTAHPNWDVEDRVEDARRLARGDLVLDDGHQTLATTVLEGEPDDVLDMPSEELSPLLLALALAVVFTAFLFELWIMSAIGGVLALGALALWHRPKRELQEQ